MYDFTAQFYFESFDRLVAKSNERLENYCKNPIEENIHNVRTSIRRLDVAWKILPKKFHNIEADKFITLRKEFFKNNSQIRDFDIIKQKLESNASGDIVHIIKKIDKKRQKLLKSAQKKAEIASKVTTIKLDWKNIPHEEIENKFKKITLKLINKIEKTIPIVTSNNKKIEQLHELRKNCKKLRYLLELTDHERSPNFINKMKEMQDILGSVRDCDITIDFLSKQKKNIILDSIIKLELEKRADTYKKFVQMQKF